MQLLSPSIPFLSEHLELQRVEATRKPGKPVLKRVNCSGYFGHVRPIERAKVT